MKVIITEAGRNVAIIENWSGPIPRVGEYIFHPLDDADQMPVNVKCVKTVTYNILAYPPRETSIRHFIGREEPYVLISM